MTILASQFSLGNYLSLLGLQLAFCGHPAFMWAEFQSSHLQSKSTHLITEPCCKPGFIFLPLELVLLWALTAPSE